MKKLLTAISVLANGTTSGNLNSFLAKNINNYQNKQQDTKIDLKTITQLNGLDIIANPNKKYKDLITNINNFNEFKSTPLANDYQIQFYDENNKEITNDKQELEIISKISLKIISSLNDKNYEGSTMIDITKQIIISDIDMQNYFAKTTLPFAYLAPAIFTKTTSNKQEAVTDVINKLKKLQKSTELIVKLLLKGIYKDKIDFNKLRNENEIYDINKKPVSNNWFKNKDIDKKANILIIYGNVETSYFYRLFSNLYNLQK